MTKRFYLATQKDRAAQAQPLLEVLKGKGWERTHAWTADDGRDPEGYALAELAGVREADVLIVLAPWWLWNTRQDRCSSCAREARHPPCTGS